MAPRGSSSKRKTGPAYNVATPLALYKRGLGALRSWRPPTSDRSDAEALTSLAACARQLQTRMGLPPGDAAATTPAGPTASVTSANPEGLEPGKVGGAVAAASYDAGEDSWATVWAAVDALEAGMQSYSAVVRHNLDLDVEDWEDEPGFLLASCHLELGKLLGRMWPRQGAREVRHLQAALDLFPDYVAGGVALAQALLSRADHPDDLQRAEQLLTRALSVAERLAARDPEEDEEAGNGHAGATAGASEHGDGGGGGGGGGGGAGGSLLLLLEANAACRREWQAGAAARRSLAMLMCQEGRDGEAAPHLAALDFTHRLARPVLHYPLAAADGSDPSSSGYERYVRAVDGALPDPLLRVLRAALGPSGRFWREHGYGRVGYFSYAHELSSPALSAIHQAATLLHRLAVARFPAVAEARYAEWWAHCRAHPSGHQLHFDSDDEGAGGVRNPLASAVIYLTGGVGGPTLVTPQLLGGPLAPHGWIVHPVENRLCVFDSTVLHGVIPGRGPSPEPGQHRITLMIAFWRDIQYRPRSDGQPGPSQPFPAPVSPAAGCPTSSSWVADLPPHPEGPDGWGAADPRDAAPIALDRVWERIDGGAAQPGAVQYDACFQGF